MEFSSPLAAMRPQPCPAWGNRRDLPMHRAMYNNACQPPIDFSAFDFRNLSMHQSQKPVQKDYFNLKPARASTSSPTSSLTADLDANFHIDKSPQVATPRRCLFTTNVMPPTGSFDQICTPPTDFEGTTPPVPSSSPAVDSMDISPLPHKAPYFVAQVTLPSPSPEATPDEQTMSDDRLSPPEECPTPLAKSTQSSGLLQLPERRRAGARPSLNRAKPLSTNSIPQRPNSAENSLPPFRFGNVAPSSLSSSSTPSLIESPIAENDTFGSMLPPMRRTSGGPSNRNSGSPCGGHVRKPSNGRPSFSRPPRKQIRRSLSMFQHPDDIMREDHEGFDVSPPAPLSSTMEVEQEHTLKLPHFIPDNDADGLPRISQDTMADILDTKYNSTYDRVVIIDCRFEYEYNGGHIESAVNFNDKQLLADQLFADGTTPSNTLLVFHCEYSVHRAPLTAKFVRSHDRNVNMENYPRLTFPEMYILDGGYSRFYSEHQEKCYPQNYVEMNDERHEQDCERGMAKVKSRPKLFRAQTFAFGQNGNDDMEDSPTAQGKNSTRGNLGPRSQSSFQVSPNVAQGIGASFARRMASY